LQKLLRVEDCLVAVYFEGYLSGVMRMTGESADASARRSRAMRARLIYD
jgi:hypothetical protein